MMADSATEFQNEAGEVVCPNSLEHCDFTTSYKLHWCKPSELIAGVCPACYQKFQRSNAGFLNRRTESPADMTTHHHTLTPDADHAASIAPGHMTQVVDFPFDELDAALEGTTPDALEQAAEVLRQIFQFCFGERRDKLTESSLKTAALRFAVIVSGLRPDALNDMTHGQLAAILGRTKACASKHTVLFQNHTGFKFSRSRSDTSRERMRQARLKQGGQNHFKPAKAKGQHTPTR